MRRTRLILQEYDNGEWKIAGVLDSEKPKLSEAGIERLFRNMADLFDEAVGRKGANYGQKYQTDDFGEL